MTKRILETLLIATLTSFLVIALLPPRHPQVIIDFVKPHQEPASWNKNIFSTEEVEDLSEILHKADWSTTSYARKALEERMAPFSRSKKFICLAHAISFMNMRSLSAEGRLYVLSEIKALGILDEGGFLVMKGLSQSDQPDKELASISLKIAYDLVKSSDMQNIRD